jgi:hypothetical protein
MTERWALLLLAVGACAAPAATFEDLDGEAYTPLRVGDAAAHVLLFTTVDCPIANGYAPAIQELADEFEPRGVRFFLVHVDPDVDRTRAREHATDFGYELPVLLDGEQHLVGHVGATMTPEAAVLTPAGELAYRGRIDDWYAALGSKRRQPTTADLRDALEALLAGRPVPVARTQAVGCFIPD